MRLLWVRVHDCGWMDSHPVGIAARCGLGRARGALRVHQTQGARPAFMHPILLEQANPAELRPLAGHVANLVLRSLAP